MRLQFGSNPAKHERICHTSASLNIAAKKRSHASRSFFMNACVSWRTKSQLTNPRGPRNCFFPACLRQFFFAPAKTKCKKSCKNKSTLAVQASHQALQPLPPPGQFLHPVHTNNFQEILLSKVWSAWLVVACQECPAILGNPRRLKTSFVESQPKAFVSPPPS